MTQSLRVLGFLAACRARNWLRRTASSPGRLIPLLLMAPAAMLVGLSAVAVLFVPSLGPESEAGPMRLLTAYRDDIRAGVLVVLVLIGLAVVSKALEGDLLAFQQGDVDFLFPAPVSRKALLLVRLLSDYTVHASVALPLTLYLVLPVRIAIPGHAGPLWALQVCFGSLALFVALTNIGRLAQAVVSSRVEGLRWARFVRAGALILAAGLCAALIADQLRGADPLATPVALLSSRVAALAFAPCALVADLYVAPLGGVSSPGQGFGALLLAAVASGALLLLWGRPACESALNATARRHALWQAVWKADASSIRAAELMGREVRGWSLGLPPLGGGAGALVAKSLLYGWRNSPWGVVVALFLALAPIVAGPAILRALEGSEFFDEASLRWMPACTLALVFAWSQRIRLIAREEFARLTYLRSLPIRSASVVASLLVVPTLAFSAFLAVFTLSLCLAFRTIEPAEAWVVVLVTPLLFGALGSVHLCSALLYPTYDPSFGKGFLSDLALMPAAGLVFGSVVGVSAACLFGGLGTGVAAAAGNAVALGWLAVGVKVAGLLLDRLEPGT